MSGAVFFDLDDTLIDHGAAMRVGAKHLHDEAARDIPFESFMADWKEIHRGLYPRFLSGEWTYAAVSRARIRAAIDPDIPDGQADRLFDAYLAGYEAAWRVFPDVPACMDSLGTWRLGIISNGRSVEQRRKLDRIGLAGRFGTIVVSEECGHAKPDPGIFLSACRQAGVDPSQAWYIGDQYELDALAARKAGLKGVWLDRAGTHAGNEGIPTLDSLQGLRGLLYRDARQGINPLPT